MCQFNQNFSITWEMALKDNNIETLEDPLVNTIITKEEYNKLYGEVLNSLNGDTMSDYIDFFYQPTPIRTTHWVFVDKDAREDFIDWCQEKNIIPSLKEIKEGESTKDKEKRKKLEEKRLKSIQIQQKKTDQRKKISKSRKNQNMEKQLNITIQKITTQLNFNSNNSKRIKLENKLKRVISMKKDLISVPCT